MQLTVSKQPFDSVASLFMLSQRFPAGVYVLEAMKQGGGFVFFN